MLLIHVDNKIITWKCSHSVSHGFNSAFKSQEFFFVFPEIRSSYSSSPSCLENQPNTDWLIDVISVVDGALIASSRLICHLLYRQDKHLKWHMTCLPRVWPNIKPGLEQKLNKRTENLPVLPNCFLSVWMIWSLNLIKFCSYSGTVSFPDVLLYLHPSAQITSITGTTCLSPETRSETEDFHRGQHEKNKRKTARIQTTTSCSLQTICRETTKTRHPHWVHQLFWNRRRNSSQTQHHMTTQITVNIPTALEKTALRTESALLAKYVYAYKDYDSDLFIFTTTVNALTQEHT